jgi:hypothetical protein
MKLSLNTTYIAWLVRRLSRIYPVELPYRIGGVLRAKAQARGWFDARRPPRHRPQRKFGRTWICVPSDQYVDMTALLLEAQKTWTHGLPVFDINIAFSDGVPLWNRDPKTGIEVDKTFGLDIDFRHIAGGVDIKYLWELNRLVWWVPIAQAYALTKNYLFLKKIGKLLDSWLCECPYPLGANWSSPVEHGIRLINWSIVWHLIGGENSLLFADANGKALLTRWLDSIYQHIRFASDNYSFYSSSDNHLIGEAAGIFVAAHTWDLWSDSRIMRSRAKTILEAEILKQFSPDGVNLEQAICYHKFSLEFLLTARLCGIANNDDFSQAFQSRMCKAIEFLAAMMDCNGKPPAIGDSDDGRVFCFVGDGAASACTAILRIGATIFPESVIARKLLLLGDVHYSQSQWLVIPTGALRRFTSNVAVSPSQTRFENGGYVLVGNNLHTADEFRITMDVGPLGYNRIAGHGHADALAVLLSIKGQDFLVDPGTYCYNSAPELRQYFRGTSAHNTVQIDGVDQSVYGGSFLWLRDIETKIHSFVEVGEIVTLEASHDGYMRLNDPVRHIRKLEFNRLTLTLVVEDRFESVKEHSYAIHWHFAPDCILVGDGVDWVARHKIDNLTISVHATGSTARIVTGQDSPPLGWVSNHFYDRQATTVLVVEGRFNASTVISTTFSFATE